MTLGANFTFGQMLAQYNVTLLKGLQYQTVPYSFSIASAIADAAGGANHTTYYDTML